MALRRYPGRVTSKRRRPFATGKLRPPVSKYAVEKSALFWHFANRVAAVVAGNRKGGGGVLLQEDGLTEG